MSLPYPPVRRTTLGPGRFDAPAARIFAHISPAGFDRPAGFTQPLRGPNRLLTTARDDTRVRFLALGAAVLALAVAVAASGSAAGDPSAAVTADLTKLQADITAAHSILVGDLGKVASDAGNGDRTALLTDIHTFVSDRQSAAGTIRGDLLQLRTDVRAARDAKVDPAGLKALAQSVRALARSDRGDVRQALESARDAVKALRGAAHS